MKRCDSCEERQATVHMTDVKNQEIQNETHLCSQCAEMEGLEMSMSVDLSDLIPDDLSMEEVQQLQEKEKQLRETECPNCGISFKEFRDNQLLGCSHDYEVFAKGLDPLIEQIHDQIQHLGKVPSGVSEVVRLDQKIQEKERELQEFIEEEAFEEAADLRDEIEQLKEEKEQKLEQKKEEVSETKKEEEAAEAEKETESNEKNEKNEENSETEPEDEE